MGAGERHTRYTDRCILQVRPRRAASPAATEAVDQRSSLLQEVRRLLNLPHSYLDHGPRRLFRKMSGCSTDIFTVTGILMHRSAEAYK